MIKSGKIIEVAFALCGAVVLLATGGCGDGDSKSNSKDAGLDTGGSLNMVSVNLTGGAEVPPLATPSDGMGEAIVRWDPATKAVSISGSFSRLSANATAAHLHGPASSTAMAGVLFDLDIPGPAAASGTLSGSGTLNAANWTAFLAGLTYVNIHTTLNSGGEIRGQVVPL
jgi:hypothetical protein